MKKRIWIPLCIIGTLFACTFVIWQLFNEDFAPHYTHSYSVDIGVQNNVYRISDIESELRNIIGELEDKTENLELFSTDYRLDSDGTGTVCFSYYFDGPSTTYSRLWERLTSQNLSGFLELVVSLPDATIYHVNYNYGHNKGISEITDPLEKTDTDILNYYKSLIKDTGYLASVAEDPNFIKIELKHDNISAMSYSMDEKKILYTFK